LKFNRPQPILQGFTLIEMMISSVLGVIILTSAYLCLQAALSGRALVQARNDVSQKARVAMRLITADLRSACPLSPEFDFIGMNRNLGDMEADNLDFATHHYTPRNPNEGDFCEVSYYVDRNPETGRFSLWRRRDRTPDEEPLAGGTREEIAEDLQGLRFEYYDGFTWYDEWGSVQGTNQVGNASFSAYNTYGMPYAVRVTLLLNPNPKKAAGPSGAADSLVAQQNPEPPMIFQTVVHLVLAYASESAGSEGSSEPESSETEDGESGAGPNRNSSNDDRF
jgi:prepilin-type N-terminal cleavage/methylation domain-containing protein